MTPDTREVITHVASGSFLAHRVDNVTKLFYMLCTYNMCNIQTNYTTTMTLFNARENNKG